MKFGTSNSNVNDGYEKILTQKFCLNCRRNKWHDRASVVQNLVYTKFTGKFFVKTKTIKFSLVGIFDSGKHLSNF
jgi:hypothetical protein